MLHYGEDNQGIVRFQGSIIDFGYVQPTSVLIADCFGKEIRPAQTDSDVEEAFINLNNDESVKSCIWEKYHADEVTIILHIIYLTDY